MADFCEQIYVKILFAKYYAILSLRRLYARMRSDWPVLFYLVPLIAGQLLWVLAQKWVTEILLGLTLIVLIFGLKKYLSSYLAILIGVISCILANPFALSKSDFGLTDNAHYLAYVEQAPRYRAAGQVELSLYIESTIKNNQAKHSYSTPLKVLCTAVDLPWRNISQIEKNSRIIIDAKFKILKNKETSFSRDISLMRRGYIATCKISHSVIVEKNNLSTIEYFSRSLKQTVKSILGDDEKSGLVLSMSIGTRDVISEDTERVFKRTGLAHLLVVSGYQVTLIYYSIFCLISYFFSKIKFLCLKFNASLLSSIFSLIIAILFILLVGIEGSSLRSGLALVFFVLANNLERGSCLFNSVLISLCFISLIWPAAYLEPSLQLSYGALCGICLGVAGRNNSKLSAYLKVCFYASVCTSIVVLFWFDNLSLVGFILNPILAPLLSVIGCKFAIISILLAHYKFDPNGYCLQIISKLIQFFKEFLYWIADFEWISLELIDNQKTFMLIGLSLIIIIAIYRRLISYALEENCGVAQWLTPR